MSVRVSYVVIEGIDSKAATVLHDAVTGVYAAEFDTAAVLCAVPIE